MGNPGARFLLGVFFLVGAVSATAGREPDAQERQVIDEFSKMSALAEPLGIAFRTRRIENVDDGDTPLAMAYAAGTCTLVVQIRNNSLYRTLVMAHDGQPQALKVRAILAHEMGHCFRQYFLASTGGAAPPPGERAMARWRHESEVQADRFALAWTAIYNPAEYEGVLSYLQTMRARLCPDHSGRYARAQELEVGTGDPGGPPRSPVEQLVEIATRHAWPDGLAGAPPR